MLPVFRRFQPPIALASAAALTLTGCATMDPSMLATLPGDLLNSASTIRDIHRNPGDLGNITRVITLVATVHRYAQLTMAQRQHVEVVVSRHYDGMVQKEKKTLRPQYETKKAEVRKRAAVRKKQNPTAAAKVEAETEKEVQQVDLEWNKAAKASVAKNYGTDFAVPVANEEGKPVVAFATVKESGVSVSDSSYISDKPGTLAEGSKVSHGGKTYAVLD
ncbi:MAG: hypothetical protein JWM59_3580 [Verrucomicrobiales bacterium]|nr:hypothetical protein [Verrucomicrobiales bacterium]